MSEFDVRSVRTAIDRLRKTDARICGCDWHGFQMNPVLSESEVSALERDHKIVLPPDYRQFVTEVGNGGAGPFYGVFPLGFMDNNSDQRPWQENDGFVGMLSEPFRFQEEWNDLSGYPEADLTKGDKAEYQRQVEQFEGKYWFSELMNGALPICHEGCALRIWLVVTGEQVGKLWEDRRSEYKGLRPVLLAGGSAATFSEWYCEWLDGCVAMAGLPNWR